jgi:tRNA threonylcarbamoyladenosine modification (KEOPS) complex Cgi121 subunit
MKYYKLNDTFICFIGLRTIEVPEVSGFISRIQRLSLPEVRVQMINARAAYGPSHLLGVMQITLECQKRGLTLSLKPEMDLLLRLSFTNQIASALSFTGLKTFHPAIIILFSTDKEKLACVRERIVKTLPHLDHKVLAPGSESKDHIFQLLRTSKNIGIPRGDDNFFTQYLIERSALVIK